MHTCKIETSQRILLKYFSEYLTENDRNNFDKKNVTIPVTEKLLIIRKKHIKNFNKIKLISHSCMYFSYI